MTTLAPPAGDAELDAELIAILACPACKHPMSASKDRLRCDNDGCGKEFAIRNGVPMLRVDMALPSTAW